MLSKSQGRQLAHENEIKIIQKCSCSENKLLTYLLPKIGFSHDEIANFVEKVYSINVPYIMPSVYTGSTKLINDILIVLSF